MDNSYSKLRDGSWGIRVAGKAVVGQAYTITKASGEKKVETVATVLWTGPDNRTSETVSLCSVIATPKPAPTGSPAPRRRSNWRPCGYPGCNPSYCDECDGRGAGGGYSGDY